MDSEKNKSKDSLIRKDAERTVLLVVVEQSIFEKYVFCRCFPRRLFFSLQLEKNKADHLVLFNTVWSTA